MDLNTRLVRNTFQWVLEFQIWMEEEGDTRCAVHVHMHGLVRLIHKPYANPYRAGQKRKGNERLPPPATPSDSRLCPA